LKAASADFLSERTPADAIMIQAIIFDIGGSCITTTSCQYARRFEKKAG